MSVQPPDDSAPAEAPKSAARSSTSPTKRTGPPDRKRPKRRPKPEFARTMGGTLALPEPDLAAIHLEHHPGTTLPYCPDESTYRCISFDGGPNTLTYLRCLLELEKRRPGFTDRTDLFAGTSDGAFAAAFLASKATIGEAELLACIEMIEALLSEAIAPNRAVWVQDGLVAAAKLVGIDDDGSIARATDAPLRAISSIGGVARLVSGLSTWADHDDMHGILKRYIDPTEKLCMGELPRDVVIVSYAVHAPGPDAPDGQPRFVQRPKVFQNINRGDKDAHQALIDVALRSAALPLFLPIHDRHIDGAVFANNPAMCAVAAAVAHRSRPSDGRYWYLKDMIVLSMGSDDGSLGSPEVAADLGSALSHRWGWGKWLLHGVFRGFKDMMLILDVVLNSDSAGVNYQAGQLLGRRYLRIAPPGQTRTVDKFAGVLFGKVEELKQMAIDTAAMWSHEADAVAPQSDGSSEDTARRIRSYRKEMLRSFRASVAADEADFRIDSIGDVLADEFDCEPQSQQQSQQQTQQQPQQQPQRQSQRPFSRLTALNRRFDQRIRTKIAPARAGAFRALQRVLQPGPSQTTADTARPEFSARPGTTPHGPAGTVASDSGRVESTQGPVAGPKTYVPLLGTRSLVEAMAWADETWLQGPALRHRSHEHTHGGDPHRSMSKAERADEDALEAAHRDATARDAGMSPDAGAATHDDYDGTTDDHVDDAPQLVMPPGRRL